MSIRDELLALQEAASDGLLRAEDAVRWAKRNPKSALHEALEWDDSKAASEYRIWQVRRLIVLHIRSEDDTPQVVSLSIDRVKEGGGYRDVGDVLRSKRLSEVMLRDALQELDRVRSKYERVKELTSVWTEVERVRRKTQRALGRPERRARA